MSKGRMLLALCVVMGALAAPQVAQAAPPASVLGGAVACAPQAWAAGSVFLLVAASIGISVVAAKPRIHLFRPSLPPCLNELRIDNLQIGDASVYLAFRRRGARVDTEVAMALAASWKPLV